MSHLTKKLNHRLNKREIDVIVDDILEGSLTHDSLRTALTTADGAVLFNLFWVLSTTAHKSAEALSGLENDIFYATVKHKNNDTVLRNGLSAFKSLNISEDIEDELYNFAFDVLQAKDAAIAHRSFGIIVCVRIAVKYPELKTELIEVVQLLKELYGVSPAVLSATNQALKKLTPRYRK